MLTVYWPHVHAYLAWPAKKKRPPPPGEPRSNVTTLHDITKLHHDMIQEPQPLVNPLVSTDANKSRPSSIRGCLWSLCSKSLSNLALPKIF